MGATSVSRVGQTGLSSKIDEHSDSAGRDDCADERNGSPRWGAEDRPVRKRCSIQLPGNRPNHCLIFSIFPVTIPKSAECAALHGAFPRQPREESSLSVVTKRPEDWPVWVIPTSDSQEGLALTNSSFSAEPTCQNDLMEK